MSFARTGIKARRTGLLELVHHGVRADTDRGWPTCHKCRREVGEGVYHSPGVDGVWQIDQTRTTIVYRAEHHGETDTVVVDFKRPFTDDDTANAAHALVFFHPKLEVP